MSTLIRFPNTDNRGPSVLWDGVADWPSGSVAPDVGVKDYDDYSPFNVGNLTTDSAGTEVVTQNEDPFGSINVMVPAAADAEVSAFRNSYVDMSDVRVACMEARVKHAIAIADAPKLFVGYSNVGVWDGGDLEVSSGTPDPAMLGLVWRSDGNVDLVAVTPGTADSEITILLDDIYNVGTGTPVSAPDVLYHRFGIRTKKETQSSYRVVIAVDGVTKASAAVNVSSDIMPQVPMQPVVAITRTANTAPSIDNDWLFSFFHGTNF